MDPSASEVPPFVIETADDQTRAPLTQQGRPSPPRQRPGRRSPGSRPAFVAIFRKGPRSLAAVALGERRPFVRALAAAVLASPSR
jgi:hypothetical protein